MSTYYQLIDRVDNGDETVLQDPDVSKVRNAYGFTPLHYAAKTRAAALAHPDVNKVKDRGGNTPLHVAARYRESAFDHPAAKELQDDGDYLIHSLARGGYYTANQRPEFKTLKNMWGQTPEEVWNKPLDEKDTNESDDGIYEE